MIKRTIAPGFRARPVRSCRAITAGFALAAAASSVTHAEVESELETVVVSAHRLPEESNKVTSSVTVIDPENLLDRGVYTLRDALNDAPGVFSTSTSGQTGAVGSMFIRGTTTAYSQVVVDGVRISDATSPMGNFLAGARMDDLGRLEVLRGANSAIHGGEALGGVIWLETAEGQGAPSERIDLEAGSFNSFSSSASTQGTWKDLSWFVGGGYETTDNDAPHQAYDQTRGTMRIQWNQSSDLKLGVTYRGNESHFDYVSGGVNNDEISSQLATIYADYQANPNWNSHLVLGHYHEEYDNDLTASWGKSLYTTDLARTSVQDDNRITINDQHTWLIGGFYDNTDYQNSIGTQERHDRWGGYTGWQWSPVERFHADATVRWEDYAAYGEETTWRVAGAWKAPVTETVVKSSIGRAFRTPTYLDLYGTSYGAGNPDLKAEESLGWDFGLEQTYLKDHQASLTWFSNDIENAIKNYPTPPVNLPGTTPTRGIEAALNGSWDRGVIGYGLAWTWLDRSLKDQPKHVLNGHLDWKPLEDWTFGVGASYVDDRSWGGSPLDDYFTVRTYAAWQATKNLRLHVRLENLTNENYDLSSFYGTTVKGAGFGVFTGATLTF